VKSQCSSCRPRFAAAYARPGGITQAIKPQPRRDALSVIPGQRGRSVKASLRRSRPSPALRHQPSAPADAKHAVAVVPVGVIAQQHQVIAHLAAVCHRRCCCQLCQPYRPPTLRIITSALPGFQSGYSHVLCSWREYAAAVGPGATTENSFPGQIRKKGLHTDRNIAASQLRPPTCCKAPFRRPPSVVRHKKTGAIGRRLVISAGVKSPPAL
jgi:hypothetical protein